MTLIVGLRGADGVVLASDSQATVGALKQSRPKLFKSKSGLLWGTAGELAASQTLYTELEHLDLELNPPREIAKAGIRKAMLAAAAERPSEGRWFEGLFAWYDAKDRRHYLLLARHEGHVEFMPLYGAVGSSKQMAEFGFFGFSRSEFLGYPTLPLEAAKMLTFMVAEDAVRASAVGVDLPIQMAVASGGEAAVLRDDELRPVGDTATAFRMHQLDFLERQRDPTATRGFPGLVPGEGATTDLGGVSSSG